MNETVSNCSHRKKKSKSTAQDRFLGANRHTVGGWICQSESRLLLLKRRENDEKKEEQENKTYKPDEDTTQQPVSEDESTGWGWMGEQSRDLTHCDEMPSSSGHSHEWVQWPCVPQWALHFLGPLFLWPFSLHVDLQSFRETLYLNFYTVF